VPTSDAALAAWDEAFDPAGEPRGPYAELLALVEEAGPALLAARLRERAAALGLTFVSDEPIPTCPVPRLVTAGEWRALSAALAQRTRALNAFLADVYGEQRIVAEGVVPAEAIATAEHHEPAMNGAAMAIPPAAVAGFDIVRGADGRLRVLEDNLRTPSGIAYAVAMRQAMTGLLPDLDGVGPLGLDGWHLPLAAALADAQAAHGGGRVVILTDGPENSAWFEHRAIARALELPLLTPDDLRPQLDDVAVVYRRTDVDSLHDADGTPTWVGELLLERLQAGRLAVVNAPGTGVADDKLLHAYVEAMVRFYLREEPLIESVRTYDLGRPGVLDEAAARLSELVLKPRAGHGGQGVVIGSEATEEERALLAVALRADPGAWVAQETVQLSRHPTVAGNRLEPRHVDLRVFAVATRAVVGVVPAALTRVAAGTGSLIVNSSQGGGTKDTWILADGTE